MFSLVQCFLQVRTGPMDMPMPKLPAIATSRQRLIVSPRPSPQREDAARGPRLPPSLELQSGKQGQQASSQVQLQQQPGVPYRLPTAMQQLHTSCAAASPAAQQRALHCVAAGCVQQSVACPRSGVAGREEPMSDKAARAVVMAHFKVCPSARFYSSVCKI